MQNAYGATVALGVPAWLSVRLDITVRRRILISAVDIAQGGTAF